MESIEHVRWVDSRVGRTLLFVAVVWTVAGSYIALQILLEQGLDLALARAGSSTEFALATATRESRTCSDDRSGTVATPTPQVRSAAWLLGMKVGRDAIARQYASVDANTLAAGRRDIETLATMAGVPIPAVFAPEHAVNANTDFVRYVESDANATSREMAVRYTGEACHLFKLGALWGYASMVRPALPGERNIFSAEIRHHGNGVVPAELWKSMIEPTSPRSTADEIFRADAQTTEKLMAYVSAARQ